MSVRDRLAGDNPEITLAAAGADNDVDMAVAIDVSETRDRLPELGAPRGRHQRIVALDGVEHREDPVSPRFPE